MDIIFNPEFGRYEVFGPNPVIRAGEPQPQFVSPDYEKCITYKRTVEASHEQN